MSLLAAELRAALLAGREAGDIQREAFRRPNLAVETKADGSPLTAVDLRSEEAIRDVLRRETPGLGFLGEELGAEGSTTDRWVVDPLDGTKSFVAGLPLFAVLIALELGGVRRLGVVHAPALGETWWAVRGAGAFASAAGDPAAPDVRRLAVSATGDPGKALLLCGELGLFAHTDRWPALGELVRQVGQARGYGDFWGHVLVAEGRAEMMVDPVVAYHDVAALEVIVTEAGGTLATAVGQPLDGDLLGPVVSSNAALAGFAAKLLGASRPAAEPILADLDLHDVFA
jgi:histidinol-phosphatase